MSVGRPRPSLEGGRNRRLMRLLASFSLLNISEWGFVTALSIHAFRVGGALDVGLIGLRLLAGALSSALLAPLLLNRSGVLSGIALARTVLLAAAAALAIAGASFLWILLFVVLDSVVAAGYRPAQSSLIPSLSRTPHELIRAVAGTSTAKTLGQAAGALLGGGAVEFVSPGAAMAGEAAIMFLAFLCGLRLRPRVRVDVDRSKNALREGLAAFPSALSNPASWPLIVASVLRTLVRGVWSALLVVVALRLLRSGSSSVGLIQAATAIGAIIALPLTATQIGRSRLALPCALSFVGAGVAVGLISTATTLVVVAALVCIWGISMALADATSLSLLHRLLPTEAFSRTVAVMESLKLVSEGMGALLAPGLVALFGARAAIAIAGIPLPLLMVVTWARVRKADDLAAGRGAIVALLHQVPIFRELDMASLEQLAANAAPTSFPAGSAIVTEGEPGDRFFVIESGQAQVLIHGLEVNRLGPGGDFGERALLRDTPRTATVVAVTDMHLQAIGREAFMEAMTGERGVSLRAANVANAPLPDLLAATPTFSRVSRESLQRLARGAQRRAVEEGSVLFEQGEHSDAVYVLLGGRVMLCEDGELRSVLEPGEIFGELSVIHGAPRFAEAKAISAIEVAVIPADLVIGELNSRQGRPE